MSDPWDGLSAGEREALKEVAQPSWTAPMLASLHDTAFSDPDWIYERKLDGVRLLAFRKEGAVRLMTRNRKDRSTTYFEVRDALEGLDTPDFVADGEVVAFQGRVTSFARLQARLGVTDPQKARTRAKEVPVFFYLFDLLHLDGRDVTSLPLRTRKRLLRRVLRFRDPLRYTQHRNEEGRAYLAQACGQGWEGLIAKRAGSRYVHGRSTDWLKLKCVRRQELVIGGFTDPKGSRTGLGALLLGYHEDGAFRYAGKVGTGFDEGTLEELRARLDRMERRTSPFEDPEEARAAGVHWVSPKLVAEIGFTEWTGDGKLRHPRFVGLRTDKDPGDVVRERVGGT